MVSLRPSRLASPSIGTVQGLRGAASAVVVYTASPAVGEKTDYAADGRRLVPGDNLPTLPRGDRGRVARIMRWCSAGARQRHAATGIDSAEQVADTAMARNWQRSEEHTSEIQSLMRISYAVFCLKKK